jgi:hypothetical protein
MKAIMRIAQPQWGTGQGFSPARQIGRGCTTKMNGRFAVSERQHCAKLMDCNGSK